MRLPRCSIVAASLIACLLAAPLAAAPAKPYGKPEKPDAKVVKVKRQGEAYCFERAIALGNIVIAGGRCYTFYVMRTTKGSFLAFGPPGPPMIPPGQLVRMSTPAGAKMKGRLFYAVPLPVTATLISVETIKFVSVRVIPEPGRVVIRVPGAASSGSQEKELELAFLQR